jgi:hypothetical protein
MSASYRSLVLLLAVAACRASTSPQPVAPTGEAPPAGAKDDGLARPLTQAQVQVAHYLTRDGLRGFTLDRTGARPKLQVDGSPDIVELTIEEDRFSGELRGSWLVAPDGKRPLYLAKDGSIAWYVGRDEFAVNSDRAAEPLPAATVTGTYVAPKQPYEAVVERLKAVAVVTRLPQMKPEHAAQLAKVDEAISAATPDMFVHYRANGGTSFLPRMEHVPQAFSGIGFGGVAYRSDDKWDPARATGLAKHGGVNRGFSEYASQGNHMQVSTLAGYPPPLAERTPGLVWEVQGTVAVFVALDGGRWVVDLSSAPNQGPNLLAGAGPESGWPAAVQATLLDVPAVSSLAKAGAAPQAAIDELLKFDDEWNTCAQNTWKGAEKQVDSGKFTEADRKAWARKVEAACKKSLTGQTAALLKLIEARAGERKALHDKAKARVVAIGANK